MARSTACNGTASVRPSATPPPQQFPGAPASSRSNPSPPPHFYPGAPKSSSPNPSTPPPFHPGAPTSSSTNPCVNQWRPVYTPAPEGLLNFGQIPPMHMYNFQPPSMHHHEQGNQRMENLHFVGTSPYDAFSTPPPPPHPKATSQSAPSKVKSSSSKRKRNIVNVDDDEPSKRTAQRLSYTPEEYVRLAPTLILEAVASRDLWIWHAFFGLAGSNNDINVLNQSPLFVEQLKGQAPRVNYSVNGKQYQQGYYLVDGIYPEWAAFVKSIPMAQTPKHKLFAQHQEGERKDVERAFGVLQARWAILRQPARLYDRGDIHHVMLACIILHNMIVDDEKEEAANILDLNEEAGASIVLPSVFTHGDIPAFADVLERDARIRNRPTHRALKTDLIEHIWKKFGPGQTTHES